MNPNPWPRLTEDGEGGGGVLGGGGVGGTGPPPQLPGFTETSSIAISDRQDVPLIPSKVS